jgi:putative protease
MTFSWLTQAFVLEDIERLATYGVTEILLEPQVLSKRGTLSRKELEDAFTLCERYSLDIFLQWDILNDQKYFHQRSRWLSGLPLEKIKAVRILDTGAAFWFMQQNFPCRLHLICEVGNRNLLGLQRWCTHFAPQLDRLILCSEIPLGQLKEWVPQLPVSCELLGLGPLLLFYSPRALLSPHLGQVGEVTAQSEESQNRAFPVVETNHGTYLYHSKDLSLMSSLRVLEELGLQHIRWDRYETPEPATLSLFAEHFQQRTPESLERLKNAGKRPWIPGFFSGNHSDSTFSQLKNKLWSHRGDDFVAEVVDVQKKSAIAIYTQKPFYQGESFYYLTPEGLKKPFVAHALKDTQGQPVSFLPSGKIGILPWMSQISPKSLVLQGKKD